MARKPRLHVPGGVYHVMLRGNAGQDIFFTDEDRLHLYDLVEEGTARFAHRVHGFCLMGNHVHLVVQVSETPLAKIVQNLSFRYTRWIHRRQRTVGHLFQGRYKAILVDADAYLLTLVRYVHRNPVRAGLVDHPEAYRWSGHRTYLGLEGLPWLSTDWVLGQFAQRLATARQLYAAFVAAGRDDGRRDDFHRGGNDSRVLADDDFTAAVLGRPLSSDDPPSLDEIVDHVCGHYEVSATELYGPSRARRVSEARGMVGWLALETGATTLSAVATRFRRDPTTLSRIVGRIDREAKTPSRMAEALERLKNTLAHARPSV
jgi:REP element-mobilizing transposase RayT